MSKLRICSVKTCTTILSRYNALRTCWQHTSLSYTGTRRRETPVPEWASDAFRFGLFEERLTDAESVAYWTGLWALDVPDQESA